MSNFTSSIEPATYISGICNLVAANGDARAVSVVSLLRSDLANDLGVGDFPVALG
jgi:hypothetical protein